MPEQQLQRLFIAPNLVQLQSQLRRQCGIFWILRHLLLQLLNFRRISRLLQQFDLRHQPLVAGVLILQRNGFQHRFRIFRTVQRNQRFCQQQADLPVLIRQLPGVFQQWQGIGVIAFLHQLHRLLRFQLFFARQHFIQQGADRLFRLRPLEAVYWLPVLEQIYGRNRAQTKLGGNHLLRVAVQLRQNKLPVVLRREAFQDRG